MKRLLAPFKNSIKLKTLLVIFGMVTFVLFIQGAWFFKTQLVQTQKVLENHANVIAKVQAESASIPLENIDFIQLESLILSLKNDSDFYEAVVYDDQNQELFRISQDNIEEQPEEMLVTVKNNILSPDQTEITGRVLIQFSQENSIQRIRDILLYTTSISLGILFILMFGLYLALDRFITRPVKEVSTALSNLAEDKTDTHLPDYDQADEIGDMVNAYKTLHQHALRRYELEQQLKLHKENLEVLVEKRTKQMQQAQEMAMENAHKAGMSEVASNVLHNIGNVLTSFNIELSAMCNPLSNDVAPFVKDLKNILEQNKNNLNDFFLNDETGKQIPESIIALCQEIINITKETEEQSSKLKEHLKHINEIIHVQQEYAKDIPVLEQHNISDIVKEAINISTPLVKKMQSKVHTNLTDNAIADVNKARLFNVVVNIIKNGLEAMEKTPQEEREINVEVKKSKQFVKIAISDKGIGIEAEDTDNIFKHGFTTKKTGHGFGLHDCANAIHAMNGDITFSSKGKNQGATFTITLKAHKE